MSYFTGNQRYNVFVPYFAPQFVAMREVGGIPGVSLEEGARGGVWVPREWLDRRFALKEDISTNA